MKLDPVQQVVASAQRYRRQRRRPLVGPTGVPSLDSTLAQQTKPYHWSRRTGKSLAQNGKLTFRDEAIIAMSIAGEVTDTSIVEVGRSRPQYQYSREELMKIKVLPLSKRKPDCLDPAYNNSRGIWDPERWHQDKKRSDTPPDEELRPRGGETAADGHSNKRRSGDPRERVRKEQDGIVLSPQRRSFNSGCFVNVTEPVNKRPVSPIGKIELPHRESGRRIGSGRILTWDVRPDTDKHDSDYGFRSGERDRPGAGERGGPGGGPASRDRERDRDRDRDERLDRYERRSFSRDFGERDRDRDRERDKDRGGRDRGGRYGNDRRRSYNDNRDSEEPEWFSSGPTSQHDTIELRGFEDIPEDKAAGGPGSAKAKKQSPAQKKRNKKAAIEKEEKAAAVAAAAAAAAAAASTAMPTEKHENASGPKGRSTPTSMDHPITTVVPHSPIFEQNETQSPVSKKSSENNKPTEPSNTNDEKSNANAKKKENKDHQEFNLDDFLKSDSFPGVPGLLTNGVGTNDGAGSRFSQWFKRESPPIQQQQNQQMDSMRSSIQDELLNNLLNDISQPNIQIPSVTESNAYFAPISPAANTHINAMPQQQHIQHHQAPVSQQPPQTATGIKLLEMLQRNNKPPSQNGQGDMLGNVIPLMKNSSIKEIGAGKVVSLEELEARMRGGIPPMSQPEPKPSKTEEDMSAFKKLLAQVSGGQAVPAANGPIPHKPPSLPPPMQQPVQQPITLMQLLNSQLKSHQQGPAQAPQAQPHSGSESMQMPPTFNHVGPLGPVQHPHQSHMQHENLLKVLQIQQQQQQQQQQKQRQQSEMLSMMMGAGPQQSPQQSAPQPPAQSQPQQRMLGVSPIPTDVQMMVNNAPSTRELLQRPEAEAIIRGLQQGEITRQHLVQQLQNPAMQHRHRDVLVSILKFYGGTTPRTVSPHANVPTTQDHILQQMLYQQQQQRIPSPMNNVMGHRVPSPREIAVHTQNIIQNALLKKKLEEQRENYRKRQEQQQRATTPVNSPAKQTHSPTPLAFTPTSVLRKMTAEKEPEGRPIVKGGGGTQQFHYSSNVDYQQQQQQQQSRVNQSIYSGNAARSKHSMPGTPTGLPNVPLQYNAQQQQPSNSLIGNQRQSDPMKQMRHLNILQEELALQQQQQMRAGNTPQTMNQNFNSTRNDVRAMRPQQLNMAVGGRSQNSPGLSSFMGGGGGGGNGGDLSPTSNQLARWFSPELLAQARAGKLPELGQTNVLSLEELERLQHASTTVHN